MKKTLILLFAAALGSGAMSSCSKSNKGKLSGEWTLSSWTVTDTDTYGNPSVTDTDVTTYDASTFTMVSSSTDGSATSTINGTINSATWAIEKDGTWTRTRDVTYTITEPTYSYTAQVIATESGTWSFIGKNKTAELGKNERVAMSVLASTNATTATYTAGGISTSDTSTGADTYAEGENVETYLIIESKSKELSLSQVGASSYTSTDSNGTTTSSSTSNSAMVLIQE